MYLAYFNLRGVRNEALIRWDLFSCQEKGWFRGINNAWLYLWELRWVACFTDPPSVGAGMGCWIVGVQWGGGVCFVGVCLGSERSFLGLHIIYVMNVIS